MISVIIVSYKVPDLLLRCVSALVESNLDQTLELIIVDNNSQDNGRELITSQFPELTWIQNSDNLGFASAVNIGIRAASGDFILLLNPDTLIEGDAISELYSFWQSHPDAGIIGGKIVNSDGSFQKQCRRQFPRPASAFFRLFGLARWFPTHHLASSYELDTIDIDESHEIDAVSGAFMSFPVSLTERIGLFDEGYFLMGEDLDFCYRAKQAGYKVYYYPDALVIHHHGASRKTRPFRSIYYGHYAMLRYYRKFLQAEYSPFTSFFVYSGILGHFLGLASISFLNLLVKGHNS